MKTAYIFEFVTHKFIERREFFFWVSAYVYAKQLSDRNEGWTIYFYVEGKPNKTWNSK